MDNAGNNNGQSSSGPLEGSSSGPLEGSSSGPLEGSSSTELPKKERVGSEIPQVRRAIKDMNELVKDLNVAIDAKERNDQENINKVNRFLPSTIAQAQNVSDVDNPKDYSPENLKKIRSGLFDSIDEFEKLTEKDLD